MSARDQLGALGTGALLLAVAGGPVPGGSAANRDRGSTREEQIEKARESLENPLTNEPGQTGRDLRYVIDLVYRYPEASAAEIEAKVRGDCRVDEHGQAVLETLWPAREGAAGPETRP